MTHMSFKCIHPLYIARGFSGQWVNCFVSTCLAMILIGGPCPIVLHPPKQFILQIIVNLISHLYRHQQSWQLFSSITDPQLEPLALVLSPGPFIERWAFPRIEGPAPHFWEKLTGSAPRSEESARAKALVKLPFPKIEGPAPQFWEKAPPLKNGQFRGQKHLAHAPNFFHSFIIYTKFTFCKKIGPNRPIQTSAVVRIFYCRLYGVPTTN